MTQRLLIFNSAEPLRITYDDIDIHGLKFEVIKIIDTHQYVMIDGIDNEITEYLSRNPEVIESNIDDMLLEASTGNVIYSSGGSAPPE